MQVVMSVPLRDYASFQSQFELDRESGRYAVAANSQRGIAGFGCEMKLGVLKRRRVFSAVYALENHLYFRVDRTEVDLADPTVSVRKTIPFPFLRRLTIRRGTDVLLDMRFRALLMELWEYPHEADFFTFAINRAATREQVRRNIVFWNASARGEDPTDPDTYRRLEQRTQATMPE
jgi:hypothetical protein